MKWARVDNGIVMEITDIDPEGRFTQEIVDQFRECPEEVEQGWTYIDGVWNAPYVDPGPTQDELKKQALDLLNAEYATKLAIIARDYNKPALIFTPGDPKIASNQAAIAADYKDTAEELLYKQGVILNG